MHRMIFVSLIGLVTASVPTEAAVTQTFGIARDVGDQRVVYTETHHYLPSGEHQVVYRDPEGRTITEKSIRYPDLPQHPQIVQKNRLDGSQIRVDVSDGVMHSEVIEAGAREAVTLKVDSSTIVDAGFDPFLRANWEAFTPGIAQKYRFAVAGKSQVITVNIVKFPLESGGARFTVTPANFLIRLVLPTIHVTYDAQRRLARYEGLTNLSVPDAGSGQVVIDFSHCYAAADCRSPEFSTSPAGR